MKAIHYVMIVCGSLAAGLPTTAAAFPQLFHPYFLMGAAVCALVTMVCGALSPKIGEGSAQ